MTGDTRFFTHDAKTRPRKYSQRDLIRREVKVVLRGALARITASPLAGHGIANFKGALAQRVKEGCRHVSTVVATRTNLRVNGRH